MSAATYQTSGARSTANLPGVPLWALTLWRPWAAHVVDGEKDVENRRWAPPLWIVGKLVAIHAGNTLDEGVDEWIRARLRPDSTEPRADIAAAAGAIVGVVRVVGAFPPTSLLLKEETSPWHMREQYGWRLGERRALRRPVPVRGAQKLWRIDEDTRAAIAADLATGAVAA